MTVHYTIFNSQDGNAGLTAILSDGTVHTLQGDNASFKAVRDALLNQDDNPVTDEDILALLKPAIGVGAKLQKLSERVTFDGSNIYFDGDVIDNSVARHIGRILSEDGENSNASYRALIAFMEKLYTNPSVASQESLYDFLRLHNITITSDGDFIAYKGVRKDGTSVHAGFGIVDGVVMDGHLPNKPGSIVEIPRSQVDADQSVGCSTGLHAGAYSYASGFAQGQLLTVKINPRDVVSVPEHSSYRKVRVSRYEVLNVTDHENPAATWNLEDENDWDDEDEDDDGNYCEHCGGELSWADEGGTYCDECKEYSDEDEQGDNGEPLTGTFRTINILGEALKSVRAGQEFPLSFMYLSASATEPKRVDAVLQWVTDNKPSDPMFTGKIGDDSYRHYYMSRIKEVL